MNRVAADIGGTNSRFAWLGDGETTVREYRNADFSDLCQVIARFLDEEGKPTVKIERMVLALPAPVEQRPVRLTNIDWRVDPQSLQQKFPIQELSLVNDFQAAAVGAINASSPRRLNPAAPHASAGPAVVAGAGTGLGQAWFADISRDELPRATEGGHADFAPQGAQQRELQAWLEQRHGGHVSCERLLSGGGLAAIHEFLGGAALDAAAVEQGARAGDATAVEAVQMFVSIFGAHAGNLALLFNPAAGIHLCGGVVAHLAGWFGAGFLESYFNKGRMRHKVEGIPVYLHDRADIGMQGAIQIALQG